MAAIQILLGSGASAEQTNVTTMNRSLRTVAHTVLDIASIAIGIASLYAFYFVVIHP